MPGQKKSSKVEDPGQSREVPVLGLSKQRIRVLMEALYKIRNDQVDWKGKFTPLTKTQKAAMEDLVSHLAKVETLLHNETHPEDAEEDDDDF